MNNSFFKKSTVHKLSFFFKNNSGKNNSGKIVFNTRSYKKKKRYLFINYNRQQVNYVSIVCQLLKKKSNSVLLSLIKYSNGSYSYIVSMHGIRFGQFLYNINRPLKFISYFLPGCLILIKFLPIDTVFSNVLIINTKFSKYIKAPGTYTKIFQRFEDMEYITFKLPTGAVKYLSFNNYVILGRNSNLLNYKQTLGKAGFNRNIGLKPKVRGVAMNPVDHPHGGRTKTSKPEVSP